MGSHTQDGSRRRESRPSRRREIQSHPGVMPLEPRSLLSAGFQITPLGVLNTSESGGAAVFRVRLTERPTAEVELPLASSNEGEGQVSRSSLVFTPDNWRRFQSVRVMGVDDVVPVVDGTVRYLIRTGPAVSADARYDRLDPSDVRVVNRDNDRAGILLSTTRLTTTSLGDPATFWVSLTTQPRSTVAIRLRVVPASAGTLSTTTVVLGPDNWESGVEVGVNGTDNRRYSYQILTDRALSMDRSYRNLDARDVRVTNVATEVPLAWFNGTYEGTYTGSLRNPRTRRREPEAGVVLATALDGLISVSKPEPGGGILTSSGQTDFRVTYGSVGGDAHFTGRLSFRPDGTIVGTGQWMYSDEQGWTGSGTWSVIRIG